MKIFEVSFRLEAFSSPGRPVVLPAPGAALLRGRGGPAGRAQALPAGRRAVELGRSFFKVFKCASNNLQKDFNYISVASRF